MRVIKLLNNDAVIYSDNKNDDEEEEEEEEEEDNDNDDDDDDDDDDNNGAHLALISEYCEHHFSVDDSNGFDGHPFCSRRHDHMHFYE